MPQAEELSPQATPRAPAAGERGLRIASFNVENLGQDRGGALAERIRLLRPQLVRLRADVLCLQEVDSQRGTDGRRRLDALATLLDGTEYADFHLLSSVSRSQGGPRDKHNLVVLSRLVLADGRQIFHDYLAPPLYRPVGPSGAGVPPRPVEWDRPLLYARLPIGPEASLHLVNLHLRAPRAAFVPGGKEDGHGWRSMALWAEGFFIAALKRAGQALEARLLIDHIFDADPAALIAVCGDFNADLHEIPVRTIRGDEEDAGNPHLAARTLVPLERSLPDSRR
jgi:endonuclease/exonuclease/phosphatase family metal-dependent hydrolase